MPEEQHWIYEETYRVSGAAGLEQLHTWLRTPSALGHGGRLCLVRGTGCDRGTTDCEAPESSRITSCVLSDK